MGIHRLILSLVLLLGLGQVAFAYPTFNSGYEVEERELDERQGATASLYLNKEALCDKNCYATRNACVAKWGPSDGNCIDNCDSCIKGCNVEFGKRGLEARVALPDEGDTRALPEAVEIDKLAVEIDERAASCIDLEGLCQKNCAATRNACISPAGLLSSAMAKCVEDYEKCMAVCPYFAGQCVDKRDPKVVDVKERAVKLDSALKKEMCNQDCATTPRKCISTPHVLIVPDVCADSYNHCVNVCFGLAPPGTKRAAISEPEVLPHAASEDKKPCDKDATGECKNQAKVCVGGRCLAHMTRNGSPN